jgi:fibronectin type 3 domain-containing protein
MKRMNQLKGWLCAGLLTLLMLAMTACGGSSSTPSTKTTTTGSLSTTGGNSGASALAVAVPAGVTLSVPANTSFTDALGNPVTGSLSTSVGYSTKTADLPSAAAALPAGTSLVAFADVSVASATAQVKNFSQPISLGFQVPSSVAVPGDAVVVYSFDGGSNQWSFAGTQIVDANGVVSQGVSHLSIWGLFKTATPQAVAPINLLAVAGDAQATLSWSAVTGATSYRIYYSTTPGVTSASTSKVLDASNPQIVTGLENATTYYFAVSAVNGGGESALSSEVSVIPVLPPAPARPSGIGASGGNAQVTVTWKNVVGATSYNVYYSTTPGVTSASPTKVLGATNGVTGQAISDLVNETTYYFVVTAKNNGGESIVSSEKAAKPSAIPQAPASPTGVTLTSGTGQVTVAWTDTVLNTTSYNVYVLEIALTTDPLVVIQNGQKTNVTSSPLVVTGLTAGGSYYIVVTAQNAVGESLGQKTPKKAPTIL